MFKGVRILGVVPARGGSKELPRKNVRLLAGEPLIGYTLRTASQVAEIDLLVVSTDDDEIASVSRNYGVRVVERPETLALDSSPTEAALLHVLSVLEAEGQQFDVILVLEPTSPLRSMKTIVQAITLCITEPVESVLAVRETRENIGFIQEGCFRQIIPGSPRRRQERQPMYIESSTIYACSVDHLRRAGTLVAEDWGALVVPHAEAADINNENDFQLVEFLILNRRQVHHDK